MLQISIIYNIVTSYHQIRIVGIVLKSYESIDFEGNKKPLTTNLKFYLRIQLLRITLNKYLLCVLLIITNSKLGYIFVGIKNLA